MGYDSRFFVVDKSDIRSVDQPDIFWGKKIADFDLAVVPRISSIIHSKYPDTNCYIYADDGNTAILEDKYGDKLKEIPLQDMIQIVESDPELDTYRRLKPFLSLLKGFDISQWDNLVVLHYGH